ncbi:MAG: glycosyltransferase, partial [Bacteroidota bacterium]|nr:glycosyltransferase [Bacteroidota bacterium]MDX5431506.1 glycosyltransferase [Bacteroidota bacterium]MDX5470230.1 glycosyltransferase [Bacteroidota bacterium]
MLLQLLFWSCIFWVIHTYALYPAWMARQAKRYQDFEEEPRHWPSIDLLIAAYNEEEVIERKIRSCLNTDYPADKLRVVIGSDRSSDRTDEIVKSYAAKDSRV